MRIVTEREEFCVETGRKVTITAFVDADGGYGCAVELDTVEYECEKQQDCSVYSAGSCRMQAIR